MFETSLVESSGQLKSKSSRYIWITGTFNLGLVAVMILLPLLHPETLPRNALVATLMAPPMPAMARPKIQPVRVNPSRLTEPLSALIAPSRVPTRIDMSHQDAPAPDLGTGVPGMSVGSNSIGPSGGLGLDLGPAPTLVKVAPPKATTPTHISSGVIAGNKLSGSDPAYPPIARAAHVSGAVVLHAIISKAGAIQSLSVVSGNEMLRANAVAAVQGWRYRPYLLNGEPTEVETTITVNFLFGG